MARFARFYLLRLQLNRRRYHDPTKIVVIPISLEVCMKRDRDINAALFSVLWPGLGQLAQGRLLKGALFVCWTAIGAAVAAISDQSLGVRLVIAGEVAIVAVWAIVDAYRGFTLIDRDATC